MHSRVRARARARVMGQARGAGGGAGEVEVVVEMVVVVVVVQETRGVIHLVGDLVFIRGIWDTIRCILWPLLPETVIIEVDGAAFGSEGVVMPAGEADRRVLVPASKQSSHRTCSTPGAE